MTHHGGKRPAIMKPAKDANGYYRTVMDGRTVKVHRVVAETWLANPLSLPCVNHLSAERTDNSVGNLEWCSVRYNAWYGVHHGYIKLARHPRQDIIPEGLRKKATAEARLMMSTLPKDRNGKAYATASGLNIAKVYEKLCRKYPALAKVKCRTLQSWMYDRSRRSKSARQNLTIPSVCEMHHTHIVLEDNIVFQCTTPERPTSPRRR